jgi:hypothetical protein
VLKSLRTLAALRRMAAHDPLLPFTERLPNGAT